MSLEIKGKNISSRGKKSEGRIGSEIKSSNFEHQLILRRSIDYIEQNKNRRITLEDLEFATSCSRFQIIRMFRSETGVTPHAFIMQRRLVEARKMLARGEPAAEVAAELGFVDQSHLIRRFKDHFGVTPNSYARMESEVIGSGEEACSWQPRPRPHVLVHAE